MSEEEQVSGKDETKVARRAVRASTSRPPPPPPQPAAKRTARRSARTRPKRSPVVPIVLVAVACLALIGAWWALSGSAPASAGTPTAALLTAAAAGDEEAFRALAAAPAFPSAEARDDRRRLAEAVRPLLVPATRAPLLTAAVAAAQHHGCDGLAIPAAELVQAAPDLVERLGGADGIADLIVRCPTDPPDGPRLFAICVKLLAGNAPARQVGAAVLQRIDGDAWMKVAGFPACLAAAAGALPDPACLEAVRHLTTNVCRRSDQAAKLGSDPAAWRAWIEADGERASRCSEIATWLAEHGAADRVADGSAKLEEHRRFLVLAQKDLDGWLDDAAWQGPLGWTRADIEELKQKIGQAQYANRSALGGNAAPKR